MSALDNLIVLACYAAISLIIFGVALWVQGYYSHSLLIIPLLVLAAAAAVQFKVNNDGNKD